MPVDGSPNMATKMNKLHEQRDQWVVKTKNKPSTSGSGGANNTDIMSLEKQRDPIQVKSCKGLDKHVHNTHLTRSIIALSHKAGGREKEWDSPVKQLETNTVIDKCDDMLNNEGVREIHSRLRVGKILQTQISQMRRKYQIIC